MWSVSDQHGYATAAEVVRGRYGSAVLALLVAITGIVATMPYIAQQLVGIKALLEVIGIGGDWPLWITFVALAAYTYCWGLRAPALSAFVKDLLIYIVVLVTIIDIPTSWADTTPSSTGEQRPHQEPERRHHPQQPQYLGCSTLALGFALALFLYPHAVTGVLAARNRDVVQQNMAILPRNP